MPPARTNKHRRDSGLTTLKDIAQAAGVCINTVSSVLNPRTTKVRVSEETRDRIIAIARRLNYRRNAAGARLGGGRTNTLGILMPNINHPYAAPVADAFEQEAIAKGFQCFIGCTRFNGLRKLEYIQQFLDHGVNGLLLTTIWGDPEVEHGLEFALNTELPLVIVDYPWEKHPAPTVSGNHFQGGVLLARHLIEVGHRKFLYVYHAERLIQKSVQDRIHGVQSVLKEAGLPTSAMQIVTVLDEAPRAFGEAVAPFLRYPDPPTVVMCSNDDQAIRLMISFAELGIKVPDDVALTGFDDLFSITFLSGLQLPDSIDYPWGLPITTIRQPFARIGHEAARLLIETINRTGEADLAQRNIELDVELVIRESSRLPNWVRA